MKTIRLNEFLQAQYGVAEDTSPVEQAIEQVNKERKREEKLRHILHPGVVRRLDAGFARSNTVHPDTGHALYAICFATGAQNVFETGTYWGFSTAYLAAAVKDKGRGKVYTFDIYEHAGKHIPKGLMPYIEMYRGKPSTETMPAVLQKAVPDLFFQDSRHDYEGVRQELEVVAPYLRSNSVVLFHDFVEPAVRQAAADVLQGYDLYQLESSDPQQLGIAVKAK